MSAPDVFISYASGPDAGFAARLANRLRAVGMRPWVDKEQLRPGQRLDPELENAIEHARCGIFLVSPEWREGNYTAWEIKLFAKRDRSGKEIRRIGVLRSDGVEAPPELAALLTLTWIDGRTNEDAAFWQLYCGIHDEPPGPQQEWERKGRELAAAPPVPVTDARAAVPYRCQARASYFCDRGIQWNAVEAMYATERHQLVFIAGDKGEAHDFFIARIEAQLRREPPADFVHVDWPVRPASREEYLERIARAFQCSPSGLIRELQKRLLHQNLLLIHPRLDRDFDDDLLVDYYTKWIPELLRDAQPRMSVKCIQPVEWNAGAPLIRAIRAIVRWSSEEEREAMELITLMEKQRPAIEPAVIPAVTIRLRPITEDDVRQFATMRALTDGEARALMTPIREGQARTSYDILNAIDRFFASREEGEYASSSS